MNYTFIGDIHSASDDLKVLLNAINTEEDRLIFLGDYIDGTATRHFSKHEETQLIDPLGVLDILMNRVNQHSDIVLLGNHDDFWVQTATGDDLSYQTWRINGGAHTWRKLGIHSGALPVIQRALNAPKLAPYTRFLSNRPFTWETGKILAVHAGVRWGVSLNKQEKDDLLWIRNDYYFNAGLESAGWHKNELGKVIVTGHTPVQIFNRSGFIKMQADSQDVPRYLIDAGSRSGAFSGGIVALTLDPNGGFVSAKFVVNQQVQEIPNKLIEEDFLSKDPK